MSQVKRRKSGCYCINLRRAANKVTGLYDKFLEPTGLSVNQYSLLRNLGHLKRASVSDLASYVGLERTTLVRTLKPLIDRRLIEDQSEEGQRNRILTLTEAGENLVGQAIPLWESAQEEIHRRIGTDKVQELSVILNKLLED